MPPQVGEAGVVMTAEASSPTTITIKTEGAAAATDTKTAVDVAESTAAHGVMEVDEAELSDTISAASATSQFAAARQLVPTAGGDQPAAAVASNLSSLSSPLIQTQSLASTAFAAAQSSTAVNGAWVDTWQKQLQEQKDKFMSW